MRCVDVAIIGAGPAGIAAAIQLKRSGADIVIFEKKRIGGLLNNAYCVENYIGISHQISGPELVKKYEHHLKKYDIDVVFQTVEAVEQRSGSFLIQTSEQTICSSFVIFATGTVPRSIECTIPCSVKDHVFYEVYDILSVVQKRICVIGAGDAAFDYALNLSSHNTVKILNRSKTKRCLPLLYQRVKSNSNISYMENITVKSITKSPLQLMCMEHDRSIEIDTDILVIAIGRQPCDELYKDQIQQLKNNRRAFIIGDTVNGLFRQTSISIGNGIQAAMDICIQLRGNT